MENDTQLNRSKLMKSAGTLINSDRSISQTEIQALTGIDISHHRERIKARIERAATDEESTGRSISETFITIVIALGISIGIGVISLQML